MGERDSVCAVVVLDGLAFSPGRIASQLALHFSEPAASSDTDRQGARYRFPGYIASIKAKPKQ